VGVGWIGRDVVVRVEIGRGGHIKPKADGSVDWVSPWPAPFNYGCLPDELGGDGDPLDAILLGPTRARGDDVPARVVGVVRYRDRGLVDDKLVCTPGRITVEERRLVERFFRWYAPLRHIVDLIKLRPGRSWTDGIEWGEEVP
jgi:inorganic pyrophosphatase